MESLTTQELVLKDLEVHTSIHVTGVSTTTGNKAMKLEHSTIKDQCMDANWDLFCKKMIPQQRVDMNIYNYSAQPRPKFIWGADMSTLKKKMPNNVMPPGPEYVNPQKVGQCSQENYKESTVLFKMPIAQQPIELDIFFSLMESWLYVVSEIKILSMSLLKISKTQTWPKNTLKLKLKKLMLGFLKSKKFRKQTIVQIEEY